MKLDRVTLTGADESVDPADLVKISEAYPFVEWGILFSKSTHGNGRPRYPGTPWLERLAAVAPRLSLSAHLCGGWVRDAAAGRLSFAWDLPSLFQHFARVQLNFHNLPMGFEQPLFRALLEHPKKDYIFQINGLNDRFYHYVHGTAVRAFPLIDRSGGAGVLPDRWPPPPEGDSRESDYCGYAGGLGPENLVQQLPFIEEAAGDLRVWIDMETRLRSDAGARFDLDKCRQVLDVAGAYVGKPEAAA